MRKHDVKKVGLHQQNVDESISPIYQPLQPDWNDTETLHRPLMARGDFSNAWVVYDEDELPPEVIRPSALRDSKQRS